MNKKPIILGLTGSIGMGKSTTAQMFADAGLPVWDADAAVSRLYAKNGQGSEALKFLTPSAINDQGVSKNQLKKLIRQDPALLEKIESIIHPLVAKDRRDFIQLNSFAEMVLLDIPLLFENDTQRMMDFVIVVSVSPEVQRQRVMARGTMELSTFEMILSKQMPDEEKRQRADFVIETTSIESARRQVQNILTQIRRT